MFGAGVRQCAVCHKNGADVSLVRCRRCKYRMYCGTACQISDWPTHQLSCIAPNYILEVTLHPNEIKNPSVTRTLTCPSYASFQDLHKALQISFDWASTHSFEFRVEYKRNPRQPGEDLFTIVAEEEAAYSTRRPRVASKVHIGTVLEGKTNAHVEYEYDFGDGWHHELIVRGRGPATDKFVCVAGEGHGAAEDVHGFKGWEGLKEAYRAAVPTEEQKELKHWYENTASNKDALGLGGSREWIWDPVSVNVALGKLPLPLPLRRSPRSVGKISRNCNSAMGRVCKTVQRFFIRFALGLLLLYFLLETISADRN